MYKVDSHAQLQSDSQQFVQEQLQQSRFGSPEPEAERNVSCVPLEGTHSTVGTVGTVRPS